MWIQGLIGLLIISSIVYSYKFKIKRTLFFYAGQIYKHCQNKPVTIKFNENRKSACIEYIREGGSKYKIYVPYNQHLRSKMNGYTVYLLKNTQLIDITQQPGIPYLVTADMLGGQSIIIKKYDETKTFDLHEIPQF